MGATALLNKTDGIHLAIIAMLSLQLPDVHMLRPLELTDNPLVRSLFLVSAALTNRPSSSCTYSASFLRLQAQSSSL
jgi:hypothetical protein